VASNECPDILGLDLPVERTAAVLDDLDERL
jgi:hypothetical protein